MLEIIQKIIAEKKDKNKYPFHALRRELIDNVDINLIDDELNELEKNGIIRTGRTINDTYIIIL